MYGWTRVKVRQEYEREEYSVQSFDVLQSARASRGVMGGSDDE